MRNMKAFRKLLTSSSNKDDARIKALIALTQVSPVQLVAMSNGLAWQPW